MSVVTMATKVMSPSSYSMMTDNRLGELNTCLQQTNSPYSPYHCTTPHLKTPLSACSKSNHNSTITDDDDEDEQIKRNKLIQAATNRLRQKRLEIKFQAMMAEIVEVQCQLDIIKLDTSTSLQLLPSSNITETQLLHFEKRLAHHKMELEHILQCREITKPVIVVQKNISSASTAPSLSSSISSLLSICSKSNRGNAVMDEQEYDDEQELEDSDYSILGGSIHHHQKRRKRRHYQQKKRQHGFMQNNVTTESATTAATAATTNTSNASSDAYDSSNESIITSPSSSYYNDSSSDNSILVQPSHQESSMHAANQNHELLALHSISQPDGHDRQRQEKQEDRNALDDVLSFLNDIAPNHTNDSDDIDGFIQDIYEILDQRQPQHQEPSNTTIANVFSILDALKSPLNKGLQWLRFAIVMALAITINLKKGPKLFL